MKIFIISGEASGDLHGANLAKALCAQNPDLELQGWGGELMENQGVKVLKHYKELAFMGFAEVVANLRTIRANFALCKEQIADFQPDAVILIDYPGFNLRMAEFIKERGIKVFYYISPQVWAWKESRVKKIKKLVDRMFVILPFEKDFYAKHHYDVDFVGHPLLDAIDPDAEESSAFRKLNGLTDAPIMALLPGSRRQEISRMLPIMCDMKTHFPDHQFVIGGLRHADQSLYEVAGSDVKIVFDQTYPLFLNADIGMVTSGTATLEAALHGLPQVVCYKGGAISYWIARMLVKIKYISLVNLIMDREIVTELIQSDLNTTKLLQELKKLESAEDRGTVLADYKSLKEKLGGGGASQRTASLMLKILQETN